MRRALVALAACGSPAPAHAPANVAPVLGELAVASGGTVRILEVTDRGVRVTRKVETPGTTIDTLVWGADGPAVMLDRVKPFFPGPPDFLDKPPPPSKHAFEIGRITADGYVPFAPLPASTWTIAHEGSEPIAPQWQLLVDRAGALWQEHCEWGFSADGSDHCAKELYVRRWPPSTRATTTFPEPPPQDTLAAVTGPAAIRVTKVDRGHDDRQIEGLACSSPTTSSTYPPPDDPAEGFAGMSDPTWLATEPPIFAAERGTDGFEITTETIVFEGCGMSRYRRYLAGPGGLVALWGPHAFTVIARGRLVATIDLAADLVAFAPRPARVR